MSCAPITPSRPVIRPSVLITAISTGAMQGESAHVRRLREVQAALHGALIDHNPYAYSIALDDVIDPANAR